MLLSFEFAADVYQMVHEENLRPSVNKLEVKLELDPFNMTMTQNALVKSTEKLAENYDTESRQVNHSPKSQSV